MGGIPTNFTSHVPPVAACAMCGCMGTAWPGGNWIAGLSGFPSWWEWIEPQTAVFPGPKKDISEESTCQQKSGGIFTNQWGPPKKKRWEVGKSSGFFRFFFGRGQGHEITDLSWPPIDWTRFLFFSFLFGWVCFGKGSPLPAFQLVAENGWLDCYYGITFPPALALKAGLASAHLTPCCNKGHETSVSKSSQKWTALKVPKKNTVACQLPVPFLLIHGHGQPLVTDCLTHYIDVFRCVLVISWMNSFRRLEKRELGAKSFHKTIGSCPRPLFKKSA